MTATGNSDPGTPDELPPTPPDKPLASDCCGGGCARCVFDIYEDALERYQRQLAQWQAR